MLTIEQQAAKRKQHILKAAQEGQAQAQALQQAKIQTVWFLFFYVISFNILY